MQILYNIIAILIVLIAIDGIYFGYKKFIEYLNNKNNSSIKSNLKMRYPALFLIGGITNVVFYNSSDVFLEILKSSLMLGTLFVLVYLNLVVIKNVFFRAKNNIGKFSKLENLKFLKGIIKKK